MNVNCDWILIGEEEVVKCDQLFYEEYWMFEKGIDFSSNDQIEDLNDYQISPNWKDISHIIHQYPSPTFSIKFH